MLGSALGRSLACVSLFAGLVVLSCSGKESDPDGSGGTSGTSGSGGSNASGAGNGGRGGGSNANGGNTSAGTSSRAGSGAGIAGSSTNGGSATSSGGANTTAGRGGSSGASSGGSSGASSGGSSGASSGGSGGTPPAGKGIGISGRRVTVNGAPFHIQGVCWNPVPRGGAHPQDLDYAGAIAKDIPLMTDAGINAVRTYEPLSDRRVLDAFQAAGIYVLNTVYPYGGNAVSSAATIVSEIKDHPAILMWVIGNEWNYNGLYVDLPVAEARARINEVAAAIKAVDTTHPISTIYGEMPPADTIAAMPNIDVWGINIYRGLTFGSLFTDWSARSDKPFYVAEYGADAWNAKTNAQDDASQAEAVRTLTESIRDNGAAFDAGKTCAGGTLFEWADEWWKDSAGSPNMHEVGGIAPGGGPHPDQTFNEEWWGVVDIDRAPRPAYQELKKIFRP